MKQLLNSVLTGYDNFSKEDFNPVILIKIIPKKASSEASPRIWSCYAILNDYHYLFLYKLFDYFV